MRPAAKEALSGQKVNSNCEVFISTEMIWREVALGFPIIGIKIKNQGSLQASLAVLT